VNTLITVFAEFVAAAVAGTPTRAEAIDIFQARADRLTNADAGAFLDAVAVRYAALGIINNGTYAGLRNEISNSGEVVSNDLFNALRNDIFEQPETPVVVNEIALNELKEDLAGINGNLQTVRDLKQAATDRNLKDAYDAGIHYLQGLKEDRKNQVANIENS
jgi:hypothetical protein